MNAANINRNTVSIAIFATLTAIAFAPTQARAEFLFFPEEGSFNAELSNQGLNPDENVLFNDDSLILIGNPVQGITNRTDTIVTFTSNETLVGSGGQASLDSLDGEFETLTISIEDASFQSLQLNPFIVKKFDGMLTLNALGLNGETGSFSMDFANGENRLGVIATDGFALSSVTLTASGAGAFQLIDHVKQVRIGGIQSLEDDDEDDDDDDGTGGSGGPGGNAIPEPGTLALAAVGALPLIGMLYRRRRRA